MIQTNKVELPGNYVEISIVTLGSLAPQSVLLVRLLLAATRNTDPKPRVRKVLRITYALPCHKLLRINILTVWNLNLVV